MNCVPTRVFLSGTGLLSSLFVISEPPSSVICQRPSSSPVSGRTSTNGRPMKYVRSTISSSLHTAHGRDERLVFFTQRKVLRIFPPRAGHAEQPETLRPIHHERHANHTVQADDAILALLVQEFHQVGSIRLVLVG